jgi:hypothetical protein
VNTKIASLRAAYFEPGVHWLELKFYALVLREAGVVGPFFHDNSLNKRQYWSNRGHAAIMPTVKFCGLISPAC